MNTKLPTSLLLVTACLFGSMGCIWKAEKEAEPQPVQEAVTQKATRTVTVNEAQVATGRALFGVCVACHGAQGEGRVGIGPQLNSQTFLEAASDDFLIDTIAKGRLGTTMVPWGATFNEDQIKAMVAFIRSLKPTEPASLDESPLNGDARAGSELFASICSACHGRTGAGYQETANGTGIGRKVFLDSVSNGFLRYIIKHGKSDTAMRGFGGKDKVAVANLSDAEIENVIAFLRENAW